MRKLFFLLLLAAVITPASKAITVENTAGQLAQLVSNTQITELTVTGTMDARDFLFITEELAELTSIDLTQVTIVPFDSGKTLYGTVTAYYANEIPRTAFFGKKLTSVALPSNIEIIGYAAFAGCYQLRSVTIPESVTDIDDYAFASTALTSINIPANVMGMGVGVFSRCESLESAVIDSHIIGSFAFLGDTNLSDVQLGPNVVSIDEGAFNGCTALKTVSIDYRSRLGHIGDEAFINSGLENINIRSLTMGSIGAWAFAQTKLTDIALPGSASNLGMGVLAHNPLLTKVYLPDLRATSGRHLRGAPALRRTVERLPDYAFAGDELLNPGTMLLYGTKSIGNYAFYNVCQDIDTMFLPSSITYLGDYAMAGMTGMKVLQTDASEVPALGIEVWAGVDQPSVPLIAPSEESTELYKAADQWMNFFYGEPAPQYILGDVNRDGYVNITDVTLLISYVLNGAGDIDLLAADMNGDGFVNITDVTLLISRVLSSASKMSISDFRNQAVAWSNATGDGLEIEAITLRPGETRTIDVALDNSERIYMAIQCDVVLPQGVTLTAVNGIDRGNDHSFYYLKNEVEENAYTLIGASLDMANFAGNEGNVMRLTVTAADDFDGQSAQIEMANVSLVSTKHNIYLANNALARINDNSGIERVTADKEIASVRYINVAGQESEHPFSGVNIVVTTYSDGTTSTNKIIK